MDAQTLMVFEESLARCTADPVFLDAFYQRFLASSPKVREKFANTDFAHQKLALHSSFNLLLRAAQEGGGGPEAYLTELADRHNAAHLGIGAELYDLWLDSLLATVAACDPQCSPAVEQAWEKVMGVGISFMCSRYNGPSAP
jgi:hemoglobin-like flavoprotein